MMPAKGAKSYSPSDYLKYLKSDPAPDTAFVGMLKLGEADDHLMFALPGDCGRWTPIPLDQIERIEHLGWAACGAHRHPLARMVVEAPKSPKESTLAALAQLRGGAGAAGDAALAGPELNCPPGSRPCFDIGTGHWTCCKDP